MILDGSLTVDINVLRAVINVKISSRTRQPQNQKIHPIKPMNKNSKRRQAQLRKENKGQWGKPEYKRKKQPFPSKDGMSLSDQRALFYGQV